MPVWHVSISVWSANQRQKMGEPLLAKREAVALLRGVGGDREWWYWNRAVQVGHLRVDVTAAEFAGLPSGFAVDDAGEAGPERPRTR